MHIERGYLGGKLDRELELSPPPHYLHAFEGGSNCGSSLLVESGAELAREEAVPVISIGARRTSSTPKHAKQLATPLSDITLKMAP